MCIEVWQSILIFVIFLDETIRSDRFLSFHCIVMSVSNQYCFVFTIYLMIITKIGKNFLVPAINQIILSADYRWSVEETLNKID